MALKGLVKPLSRRRTPASRSLKNDSVPNDDPFVSSDDEDKKYKHQQQTKAKIMKWILWASLALAIPVVVRPQSRTPYESALRGWETEVAVIFPEVDPTASASGGNGAKKSEVVLTQEVDLSDSATGRHVKPVEADPNDPSVVPPSRKNDIEKGLEKEICGTKISVNLADTSKWPTPFTPLLGEGPSDIIAKEVVLLKAQQKYGNLGAQINSFFHAYDFAYDHGRPLYITKGSWALDGLFELFFGWEYEQSDKVFATLEKILRVKIVEDEHALERMGIKVPDALPPNLAFHYTSKKLDSSQVRNHRETLLRQLFQHPAVKGDIGVNVCSSIDSFGADKYTVIHFTDSDKKWLSKLSKYSGKNHTEAAEMEPGYVKNILTQTKMLGKSIFPIFSPDTSSPADSKAFVRLSKDPQLAAHIKHDNGASYLGDYVYLAVLADVYLGSPVDHLCMCIARMRMALGFKNTYILTKKEGQNWVSYVDDTTHLEMYEAKKLGPFMA